MTHSIAIIGGGIIGFTIAQQLVQCGAGPITLFDRDLAGYGASARSAGLHFPLGRAVQARAMAVMSQHVYESEIERNPAGPIRRLGLRVHLAPDADTSALDVFLDSARLHRLTGPGPLVRGERLRSWQAAGAHHCHVPSRLAQLVKRLTERITLREGCVIKDIEESGATVRLRLGDGTTQDFDRVVLAPGPWAREAPFTTLTEGLDIRIKRIVAFHVDAPAGPEDAAELFLSEDAFLLPVPAENRWIFSYTCTDWNVSPATMPLGVNEHDRAAARAILVRYVPQWADRLNAGRVFCDAYNGSLAPLVCPVGRSGRIVFAGAANGSGYRLAPALAERVAQTFNLIS